MIHRSLSGAPSSDDSNTYSDAFVLLVGCRKGFVESDEWVHGRCDIRTRSPPVMIATDQRVTVTPKWVISKILLIFDPVGLYM
jgi:hypothetical protein